jgi:hypothetical protein
LEVRSYLLLPVYESFALLESEDSLQGIAKNPARKHICERHQEPMLSLGAILVFVYINAGVR